MGLKRLKNLISYLSIDSRKLSSFDGLPAKKKKKKKKLLGDKSNNESKNYQIFTIFKSIILEDYTVHQVQIFKGS